MISVYLIVNFTILTGTDLLGLEVGVPNGDPGLLFSLLASSVQKTTKHSFSDL